MSYKNTTKQNMIRNIDRRQAQERVSEALLGSKSVAVEIKVLKDSGKSCSLCSHFIESLVRCRKGKRIISQFNICVKFQEKEGEIK